ncbi:MAG TPA: hypothetical protein VN039_11760, partial [Nitrospira sp.]|nr:hypothetical protein [Nitrospira sp.]
MPTNVITISEAGVVTDYTRYIYGGVQKTDNAADPNLLDFSLFSYNRKVSMPKAGAYVTITTATYGAWFTGYIITDPEVTYIGEQRTVGPRWAWKYQATSDELVLNKHPLGIIPPFINQTQGQILKQLVAILSPATVSFNVSGIQDGMLLPRYVVDPNQHFSDVVKSFAQSANFRFSCVSRAMTFAPKDSTPLTITVDGANVNFTPGSLRLQPVADSIVNQAIVLGNIEPQNYMNEFFVGDGATAKFALISSVYGADSATLIDDSFTNNTIDDSKWTVYDPTGTVLFPFGGTINAVGGSNNRSYDVSLQSLNLVPLEGTLRLTHGEWDFVQFSSGIIGGLFTGNVTSDLSSLLYGISVDTWRQVNNVWTQISPTTATATDTFNLHPIVNGQVDMNQWAPIDTSKRYIMRTLFATQRSMRQAGQWSFVDATGNVVQIPGGADADTAYFSTYISEVDPNTGQITNFWVFNNTGVSLSSQQTYAYYCPLVVDYCNLTFTSVTVSCPIMAQLRQAARGSLNWVPAPVGPNEIDSYDGLAPVATIVDSNQGATTKSSLLGTRNYNPGQASLQYFSDQPVPIPANTLAAINPDLYAVPNPIRIPWGSTSGNTTVSWANAPSASMELWINGAGVSPGTKVASGGQTGSYSATGVSNGTTFYLMDVSGGHPGNLVVYLTIETEIMYIPQPGDLVWLQYRSAGAAIGFAQDSTSIDNEAAAWGDDGIRSKTVMNIQPLPRTSHDCEIIASAIVQGNSYQHYSGQYTMPSGAWFSGEPQAGTIIKFQNLPADFPSTLQAESVTQVVTTLDHLTPEHFTHAISFGPIDTQSAAMSVLRSTDNVFTPQDTAQIPDVIEISSLGLTTVPDVTTVSISGWDANSYYLAISDPPPNPGGYEVRYSDNGWGADDGHNLVIRTTNQTFAIPRNARGKVCYIRAHDSRNALLYSEDFTQSAWIKGGGTPPTVSNAKGKDPDDKTA